MDDIQGKISKSRSPAQEEQAALDLAAKYRRCFLKDEDSMDVFEDLLTCLGFWKTIDDEEDRVLYNAAFNLLNKMAIVVGPNTRMVLRSLLQVPMPGPRILPEPGPHDVIR